MNPKPKKPNPQTPNPKPIARASEDAREVFLPISQGGVCAGFPSPAADYADASLDLNKELIRNPSSTFYARVSGDSMKDAGIEDGDLLVIDKSLSPSEGDVAVCFIDGEFTLKRIHLKKDGLWLLPANADFQPIRVTEENNFLLWGIVTYSIKDHKKKK